MISPRFIIGVSGHRKLADSEMVGAALRAALEDFRARARAVGGDIELFTSIAYGCDTLAVEAARELGVAVHLVLPKPVETDDATHAVETDEGFAADFWDRREDGTRTFRQSDWDRAWKQIQDAQVGVDGATLRMVRGSQSDPECYYDAGVQMLESCDALIAVWDYMPARGLGGTENMVAHVRNTRPARPIRIIHAITGEVEDEHLDEFASGSEVQMREIGELNKLCPMPHSLTAVKPIFDALDASANASAKASRSTMVLNILLHGGATIIAGFAAILPSSAAWLLVVLASIEFVMVTYAWWLWRKHTGKHTHERWLRARFGAELVRGMMAAKAFLDPLTPHVLRHAPRWRRFSMTMGLLAAREVDRTRSWQARRDEYAKARIDDQLAHFARKQKQASVVLNRTRLVASWATKSAPWFVLFALGYKCSHVIMANALPHGEAEPNHAFSWSGFAWTVGASFLPILIPLIAGVAGGLRAALDATRRTHRYSEMAERLDSASQGLRLLKTETTARRVISSTEEVLLDELIEWHLAEQQNGNH